jgi:Serine kinase of the HPr protein, regulates carbohydrate metabolism
MEVIKVFDRPACRRFYKVAGRLLFIESVDLRLGNLIEPLFAGWQLEPVALPDRSPDIRIQFFCGDALPEIPANLNRFEIADGGQCYTDGADYYLALGKALVRVQTGSAAVWVDELAAPAVLAKAASFSVCAALRRYGLFELHAAGVINPDSERGVLIIGPSGSGKSTLALQLAKAGWPYLSDDELLLSLVDGEVEARGFRSFFAVKDGGDSKTCFEPGAVLGSERRLSALPGVLLFTSLSAEETTRFRRLTQAETMMRLLRACPWATYDTAVAPPNLELLSKLARQTSAFDLFAGSDLLRPGFASDLLLDLD